MPAEPEVMAPRSGPVIATPLLQPAQTMPLDTLLMEILGRSGQPMRRHRMTKEDLGSRVALFPEDLSFQRPARGGLPEHGDRTNHVLDFKLFNYLPRDMHLIAFVIEARPELERIAELERHTASSLLDEYNRVTELHNRYAFITHALYTYMEQSRDTLWALQLATSDDSDTDLDDEYAAPSGPVAEVHAKYTALYKTLLELRDASIDAEWQWRPQGSGPKS